MSSAAMAYARAATLSDDPVEVKARLTLKAARKLQAIVTSTNVTLAQATDALEFNEKVWRIFLGELMDERNEFSPEYRKNMQDVGIFALAQTWALLMAPLQLDEYEVLIEINQTFAKGLREGAAIAAGRQTPGEVSSQVSSQVSPSR